jgi:signal transduction histidine kinase
LRDGLYDGDDHLALVQDETDVMARLLDDLSLLSNADAGALRLNRQRTTAAELVDAAVAAHRPAAEAAGVRLEVEIEPAVPTLDVDPVRIGEVLSNLVTNAIRHTPRGGSVTIRASRIDAERIAFEVADTGKGIAPDELEHVFERFAKAPDSRGSGLGLAIARSLVRAHGGEISASSDGEHGTTVRFVLPRA